MKLNEITLNRLIQINNAISELLNHEIINFSYVIQLLIDESNIILGDLEE